MMSPDELSNRAQPGYDRREPERKLPNPLLSGEQG